MISSLRNTLQAKLFALYTHRAIKTSKRRALSNPHSGIGLLYTYDPAKPEKTDAVVQVVKKLQAEGKQVHVLCYLPTTHDNKVAKTDIPFDTITKHDINLLGSSKNDPLNRFFKSFFSYLYHLDLVSDPVLDYVVAKCIAHYKIGNYLASREPLFELMFKDLVQPGEEISFDNLIAKMFNYTQLLKI